MAENIAYGDMSEALDMEKIGKAGRMANADDFIKNLPHGYHTHLGDRATTLSGGQRQRCFSLFLHLKCGFCVSSIPILICLQNMLPYHSVMF